MIKNNGAWVALATGALAGLFGGAGIGIGVTGGPETELIEMQQQAVDYGYAEWADLGYGKTEFRFIEPGNPSPIPEPKPIKPIGAVGSAT